MDTAKLLNVIGLGLELLGVLLIATADYLTRKAEAEYEAIPGNPFLDIYESSKNDELRFASPQERSHNATSAAMSAQSKLRLFRVGLSLIAIGMCVQLVGLFVEPDPALQPNNSSKPTPLRGAA